MLYPIKIFVAASGLILCTDAVRMDSFDIPLEDRTVKIEDIDLADFHPDVLQPSQAGGTGAASHKHVPTHSDNVTMSPCHLPLSQCHRTWLASQQPASSHQYASVGGLRGGGQVEAGGEDAKREKLFRRKSGGARGRREPRRVSVRLADLTDHGGVGSGGTGVGDAAFVRKQLGAVGTDVQRNFLSVQGQLEDLATQLQLVPELATQLQLVLEKVDTFDGKLEGLEKTLAQVQKHK